VTNEITQNFVLNKFQKKYIWYAIYIAYYFTLYFLHSSQCFKGLHKVNEQNGNMTGKAEGTNFFPTNVLLWNLIKIIVK
jgi:hypothetical protein